MKIGILTLPFNNNYGGYLQAYALMTVLKGMGHDVELIYRKHNRRPLHLRIEYFIKAVIKRLLGRKQEGWIPNQEKELRAQGSALIPFLDNMISPKTKPLYSTKELAEECRGKYDAIVVGSDQIWRPDYVPNIENFYLDFTKDENVLKIAYAASFGERYPQYTPIEIVQCGKLIAGFDAVGLREDSGKEVINDFQWKCCAEPQVVLDPTMLLDKTHYELFIQQKDIHLNYVLSYILDENEQTQKITETITSEFGLTEKKIFNRKKRSNMLSMEDWLTAIHDASFVVTDSFHGTVFCILFNVPFAVCVNKDRGAERFYTLLSHFDLKDRIISSIESGPEIFQTAIDWKLVNKKLVAKREESMKLLEINIG